MFIDKKFEKTVWPRQQRKQGRAILYFVYYPRGWTLVFFPLCLLLCFSLTIKSSRKQAAELAVKLKNKKRKFKKLKKKKKN